MVAIFSSFIPDTFPEFFGDVECEGNRYLPYEGFIGCQLHFFGDNGLESHGPNTHWGARHYLWMWMGICLAITQAIGIKLTIDKHLQDESRRTKETL